MGKSNISVVVPMHNEQDVARAFHETLTRATEGIPVGEIVYVDDGSSDGTLEILQSLAAEDLRVRVLSLSRNFGHQAALTAGLDVVSGDAVVMMDGDLQHPPEMIPEMVAQWQRGADIVFAIKGQRQGESHFKVWSANLFYRLIRALSGVDMPPGAADFRLMDARAAESLRGLREGNRYMRGLVGWLGLQRTFVEFDSAPRAGGEPSYSLRKSLSLAADAVFSFSVIPLRIAAGVGLVVTFSGLLYAIYAVYISLVVGRAVTGWSSLLIVVLVFGGLQLSTLGLVGEYVGRVHAEVRNRPLYLVGSAVGFDEDITTHYDRTCTPYRQENGRT